MTGYSSFSIFALLCYLFLFLTFISSGKNNKTIRAFMALMVIMILWAGGSYAMRLQLFPGVVFWHHVSLLGMTLIVAVYSNFVLAFLEERPRPIHYLWIPLHCALFLVNLFTGLFIPEPIVRQTNGEAQFVYEYSWYIYLFLLVILPCLIQMIAVIYRHCKGNYMVYQQLRPIILGLLVMVAGHIAATFPVFSGIPLDIMSGPVNAIFIFYSLYKKRMFKMTVLFSKPNYLFAAFMICGMAGRKVIAPLQELLTSRFGIDTAAAVIAIVVLFMLCTWLLYMAIALIFNMLFVRTEHIQQNRLRRFGEEISHVLSVSDILAELTETIQELTHIDNLIIFAQQTDGDFRVEHTSNPLAEKNHYLRADHPLLTYFKGNDRCIDLQEFSRATVYRSMWESEKKTLQTLNVSHFVPLISQNTTVGVLILPVKKNNAPYSPGDLTLIHSACSLCADALHDAGNYERAIDDARKDKLTGLINHKYFFELLDIEFEKYKESAISLALLNLDDFKVYNQLYGAQQGDTVLQRIAGIMLSGLTESCTAARVGGKEFAILLPGYDIHSAKLLVENLAAEIGKIHDSPSAQAHSKLTVSAGICAAPYMASSSRELFQNAETAVYTVKRSGKNAVLVYSAEILQPHVPAAKPESGYRENESTVFALTAAIDAKDHYTFQHSQNVAYYAVELAKATGLESDLIEVVKEAALLHDIGKIGIREDILNKPGPLTGEEYDIMKSHVENAVNIIQHLPSLEYVIPTVLSHHEHYDGAGYPRKLAGEDIPIMGRILCIADSFDAMTSIRSYKDALSRDEALAILHKEAGKQFDPKLALLFSDMVRKGTIEVRSQSGHAASPADAAEDPRP